MARELLRTVSLILGSVPRGAILRILMRGPANYSSLRKSLGKEIGEEISDGRLAWHLKVLEADGVIKEARSNGRLYAVTGTGSTAYQAMIKAHDVMTKAGTRPRASK